MLRNQWFPVLPSRDVGVRPVGIRRFGRPLVLWRSEGGVRCAIDACPHRGAALSRGRVEDGQLRCPYHGLGFDSAGACVHVPWGETVGPRLPTLPVHDERGLLWVWHGDETPPPEVPWTDAMQAELGPEDGQAADLTDTFDVSYLRVMENLTDFHHVPVVHRNTVPIGATLHDFVATREGEHIVAEGRLGDSFTARAHVAGPFFAVLSFGGTARFAVAVCPIDRDHCWLFARYRQELVRIWGLRRWVTRLLGWFDYRLLQRWQDAPVWRSQRLADPADIGRYQLLGADAGVRHYFQMHQELTG